MHGCIVDIGDMRTVHVEHFCVALCIRSDESSHIVSAERWKVEKLSPRMCRCERRVDREVRAENPM